MLDNGNEESMDVERVQALAVGANVTESLHSLVFQHEDGAMRRESSISYWHEIKHLKKAWLVVWPVWFALLEEYENCFVTCIAFIALTHTCVILLKQEREEIQRKVRALS